MEDVRKCSKCGRELPLEQFYKQTHRSGNIGYRCYCIDCNIVIAMERHRKYPHKQRESSDRWRKNNPEKRRKSYLNWLKNNPEKKKAATARWYQNNKEAIDARCAEWRKNNADRYRGKVAERARERRAESLNFRIIGSIRAVMYEVLRGNVKSGHTVDLLGCSIEELRQHLERQFKPGMTWDNYGRKGWHIDHIIPLSYFDHTDPEQQKRVWHYTNLQPLWALDNLKKGNKIEERQLMLL